MIGLINHPHILDEPAVGELITMTLVISIHVHHAIPELFLSLMSN
jgi:hypothetical protein